MTKRTIVECHHGPYQSTQGLSSYNLTSKYRFRVRVHISTLFYEKDFVFQTCGVDDSIDAQMIQGMAQMFFNDPFTGRDFHTSTVEFRPISCFGNSFKTLLERVCTTHGLECTVFHMTNDFKKKMTIFFIPSRIAQMILGLYSYTVMSQQFSNLHNLTLHTHVSRKDFF